MFKNVLISTVLYSLIGLLPSIVSFILLPLYLTIISVDQYGVYVLVNSFSTILGVIMGLKLEAAYRIFYFDQKDEPDKERYLSTLFTFILIISTVTSFIVILFGNYLFKNVFGPEVGFFPYGFLAVINVFLGSLTVLYAIDCQNRENRLRYVWYSLSASAISICIQYVGIVVFEYGILSFFVSVLISGCLQFAYIVLIGKFKIGKIDREMVNASLKYSVPLIPFLFLLTVEQQMDRFFLKKFHSLELVGIYAILLTASGFFSMLINSLDNAIRPGLFQNLKTSDTDHDIKYYQLIYVFISLAAVIGVVTLASILPRLIGNLKYLSLLESIPLFALSIIPLIYVRYYAVLFSYKKDSNNLTLVSFFKLLLLIAVYYLFVPMYGIDGILLSLFIANVVNALIFYILIKYKHKLTIAPTYDVAMNLGICVCLFIFWWI